MALNTARGVNESHMYSRSRDELAPVMIDEVELKDFGTCLPVLPQVAASEEARHALPGLIVQPPCRCDKSAMNKHT